MASRSVDSSTKGNDSHTPTEPGVAQIWMGDLDSYMDVNFLRSTFENLGVKLNNVYRVKKHGQLTKYAFLELKDPSQVEWVLGLHNTPIPNCPKKQFVLNRAGRSIQASNRSYIYSVFVAGFRRVMTTDQLLYDIFKARYPSTTSATVALDQWGRRKSYGFVRLTNYAERIRCVEQMNGQVLMELGLRALTVKPAANDTMLSRTPSTPPEPPPTPINQSNHSHVVPLNPESDSEDEEVDPNPPVNFVELNREYFSQDQELFVSMESCRWHPVVSLNAKLDSRKTRVAVEVAGHWSSGK